MNGSVSGTTRSLNPHQSQTDDTQQIPNQRTIKIIDQRKPKTSTQRIPEPPNLIQPSLQSETFNSGKRRRQAHDEEGTTTGWVRNHKEQNPNERTNERMTKGIPPILIHPRPPIPNLHGADIFVLSVNVAPIAGEDDLGHSKVTDPVGFHECGVSALINHVGVELGALEQFLNQRDIILQHRKRQEYLTFIAPSIEVTPTIFEEKFDNVEGSVLAGQRHSGSLHQPERPDD
ncbi:hypothetical protein FA15DRAFT_661075 [Coprinopsis marcescibilis]|uniref:Uncharacterized protein n=1 Tax=Coprinopsis marcescibilis TaxID=230819 RepID=A0A5C3KDX2_COPMA|nr:hypothetical protein FA15DRAFT_661075 [Coprinopsis marcescibilis]